MINSWINFEIILSFCFANINVARYGFCTQRAQKYKMNYSFPTTNQTVPVPLLGRRNSPGTATVSAKRKAKDEQQQHEEFV